MEFKRIVADGGREFRNQVMRELQKKMNIRGHTNSALHPIAAGQVERFNRTMGSYLKKVLDSDKTLEWPSMLKPLMLAYNSAWQKSTKFSPMYLTFLREADLPGLEKQDRAETEPSTRSYASDAFERPNDVHTRKLDGRHVSCTVTTHACLAPTTGDIMNNDI